MGKAAGLAGMAGGASAGAAVAGPWGAVAGGLLGGSILGGSSEPNFGPVPNAFAGPSDEHVTALQRRLDGMQMPSTNLGPVQAYAGKDYSKEALPEFDTMRNQTSMKLNAQNQGAQDALQRKFASMGNLNSGAAVKAMQNQDQASAENMGNAMNEIGAQEAQTRRGLQESERNKEFQSGESTKALNANRELQSKQIQMQENQFMFDSGSKIAQLDLGYKSAQQQAADDQFNAAMQGYTAKHSGGLLGAGGMLGTGIGI